MTARIRWRQLRGLIATKLDFSSLWWPAGSGASASTTPASRIFDFESHPSRAAARRTLLSHAHGTVLELAAGSKQSHTALYPSAVSSITLADRRTAGEPSAVASADRRVKYVSMDSHCLKFGDNTFDVVLDMFGLCCYARPDQVLSEMWRVINKSNPKALILLLEHGRTASKPVNDRLETFAQVDLISGGCDKSRPICDWIMQDPRFQLVELRRWEFHQPDNVEVKEPTPATFWFVLKPVLVDTPAQ